MSTQSDPRFARLKTDPRFRRPKQKQLKVEIDDRFRDVLESEEFGGKGKGKGKGKAADVKVDKRGRPIAGSHHQDQLKRFYRLRSVSPSAGSSSQQAGFVDYARGEGNLSSSGSEDGSEDEAESEASENELELGGKKKVSFRPDYDSEDSDDDDDMDSEASGSHLNIDLSEDEGVSAFPPELDGADEEEEEEEDGPTTEPTNRIAAVNLDWDNLRAVDLFAVFNSFLRDTGRKVKGAKDTRGIGKLVAVKIFPSEFGKERMKREEMEGPGGGMFVGKKGSGKGARERAREKKKGGIVLQEELEEEDEDEEDSEDEDGEGDEDEDITDDEEALGESDGSVLEDEIDDSEHDSATEDEEDDEDADDGLPSAGKANGLEVMSDVSSNAGSEDIDMDQLRQYQLERLRYYYAIAIFSTVAAAEHVMDECNGTEFERTANVFDLTFVPEGMDFSDDDLHDEATKEPKGYKGTDFVTDALRHSKVKLTWDQDDPNRSKLTRKAMTREEIEEQDFKNLVAASDDSASSSDDEEDHGDLASKPVATGPATVNGVNAKSKKAKAKERKDKLRALLLAGNEEDGDIWGKAGMSFADMQDDEEEEEEGCGKGKAKGIEITFRPALAEGVEVADDNLTSLEKYQMRMKERKSRKKEKLEMRRGMKDDDGKEGKINDIKEAADDFFGDESDGESDLDSEVEKPVKPVPVVGTKQKKSDTAVKAKPVPAAIKPDDTHADLQSGMDKEHFSMKDIVRQEKADGSKRKRKRPSQAKKEAKAEALGRTREAELGQEGWKINVKDPRFKALHEEAEFAIDPSNPHFTKTNAMKDLLAERARVRSEKNKGDVPPSESRPAKIAPNGNSGGPKERDLSALVQSVKRKAELGGGAAKSGRKRHRK